jgi:hypothetical protein
MKIADMLEDSICTIIVCFSGGKDSIALVLYLLEMGIAKDRIHLHHHMVDGAGKKYFDWPCTESYCIAFAEALGLRLLFSYREGGIMKEVLKEHDFKGDVYFQKYPGGPFHCAPSRKNEKFRSTRRMWPAVAADIRTRWCSGLVKIDVLRTAISNNPYYKTGNYLILTGERRQESEARAKYREFDKDHHYNTKLRFAICWRAIIDWHEIHVWEIMARHKIQPHPCYMIGWSRCSCRRCIFGDQDIWATLREIDPESLTDIEATEKQINHTLYNKMTITDKAAKGTAFSDLDPYWIQQAFNDFTAPIIVPEWKLPRGAFDKHKAGSI